MDPSNLQPVEDDPTPAAKKTKPQAASRKQKGIRATEHDIAEGRQRTLQPGPQAAAGSSSSSGPPATCVICHADIQPGAGAACQECDGRLHHMCSFEVCGIDTGGPCYCQECWAGQSPGECTYCFTTVTPEDYLNFYKRHPSQQRHSAAPLRPLGAGLRQARGAGPKETQKEIRARANAKRYEFNPAWEVEFDWLAQDGKNVWCKVCKAHKSLAASDAIGTGTAEFGSVRKDKITGHADIRTHTGMRHMLCQVEADKKKQAQQVGTSAAALRGKLGKHLTFTQKDVIIGRLFTIVHALAKKHVAMNAMSDICDMVRACDAVIGNQFWGLH